jgi:hypothetical protein
LEKLDVLIYQTRGSSFRLMHTTEICSAELDSAKSDGLVFETGGSGISRNLDESSVTTIIDPDDWQTPLKHYLENPGHIADRKVRWQALKYVVLDNILYH